MHHNTLTQWYIPAAHHIEIIPSKTKIIINTHTSIHYKHVQHYTFFIILASSKIKLNLHISSSVMNF